MAGKSIDGDSFKFIIAGGTTVLSDKDVTLKKAIFSGTYIGSVEFYDSATAAGTTAGKQIYNVGLPLLNQYRSIDINARGTSGLTVVATGTPTLLVTWGE